MAVEWVSQASHAGQSADVAEHRIVGSHQGLALSPSARMSTVALAVRHPLSASPHASRLSEERSTSARLASNPRYSWKLQAGPSDHDAGFTIFFHRTPRCHHGRRTCCRKSTGGSNNESQPAPDGYVIRNAEAHVRASRPSSGWRQSACGLGAQCPSQHCRRIADSARTSDYAFSNGQSVARGRRAAAARRFAAAASPTTDAASPRVLSDRRPSAR